MKLVRHFTKPGEDPYDLVEWERRTAAITNEKGEVVFKQEDCEVPKFWSMMATNVVVSKYFRGPLGSPTRENSARQLIGRVADTLTLWGRQGSYFAAPEDAQTFHDELTHLLLHQHAAFNSPVWFNVGVELRPQCSACFINSVEDSMHSIMRLAHTEGMLFKYGSGTGSNLSTLRSAREKLHGGGEASGPVSFMKGFDAFAGVIKSGGKTRRAAKMVILNADHPDILDFIDCKAHEEKKAWVLIDSGYDGSFNGEAYSSIFFQNSNNSVRVTDEFMKAYEEDKEYQTRFVRSGEAADTLRARDVVRRMADAAWLCGDPGIQFDTTVNKWHTCKTTGRINASNPCVTGDTLVATSEGYRRIVDLVGHRVEIINGLGQKVRVDRVFKSGTKPVYELKTRSGYRLRLTADHKVYTVNRGDVPACELRKDDAIALERPGFGTESIPGELGELIGAALGDGCITHSDSQDFLAITLGHGEQEVAERLQSNLVECKRRLSTGDLRGMRSTDIVRTATSLRVGTSVRALLDEIERHAVLDESSSGKRLTDQVYRLDSSSQAAILRGLFTTDGTVANYGEKSQFVALDSTSLELLRQVQLILLGFGIKSKLYENRRALGHTLALLPDGKGGTKEYEVQQMHSLRISRASRLVFEREIGFLAESVKARRLADLNRTVGAYRDKMNDKVDSLILCGTEDVYDLTEPVSRHFVANGLVVHNCSEYMFLDDSACNLASLNLLKFLNDDGTFDVEGFCRAVEIVFLAQEIIVSNASYPTDLIGVNSEKYRPLGLGYANLGALLMALGVPYDSEEGHTAAAVLTSLMTGEAYRTSARISATKGPFEGFKPNRESMLNVMGMHREATYRLKRPACLSSGVLERARHAWDEVLGLGAKHGIRNAQATVIAPTGTIGFMMDCDTTGIEPDLALVKYKKLVGGGMLKIVNNTVPRALRKLGYGKEQVDAILQYIDEHETIEGAPGLRPEHLPVFDCSFRPMSGVRSIDYMGHVRMMAAVQPFVSGAISKTVNMPHDATSEEIEHVYHEAWRMGLKALAIYRDGCKRTQPLNTGRSKSDDKQPKAAVAGKTETGLTPATPAPEPQVVYKPIRERLPAERRALTHKFEIGNHEGYLTVGLYEDGRPGELFIRMAKEGSTISGLMDCFATSISIALQYGVPLQVLIRKFVHTRFEPSGFTRNREIPMAKSIMDYIFRWLASKFLGPEEAAFYGVVRRGETSALKLEEPRTPVPAATLLDEDVDTLGELTSQDDDSGEEARRGKGGNGGKRGKGNGEAETATGATGAAGATIRTASNPRAAALQPGSASSTEAESSQRSAYTNQTDAPPCPDCGAIMVRNGACYKCLNCGESLGCG